MILAFLIPSIDDLRDRYEVRRAVDRYVGIGRQLLSHQHYAAAEQAFDRALELGGNQHYEILEWKLRARIARVSDDPEWRGELPEDLDESDFLYLLEVQQGGDYTPADRAGTLAAYGAYLASAGRTADAERALREATTLEPRSVEAHVHLGNLFDDRHDAAAAEAEYRRALAIDPADLSALYNLGLLLAQSERAAEAQTQFEAYIKRAPNDPNGLLHLGELFEAQGHADAAVRAYESALRLDPDFKDAKTALHGLRDPSKAP